MLTSPVRCGDTSIQSRIFVRVSSSACSLVRSRHRRSMEKFGFKIQTRTGTTVDRLVVHAVDQAAAEKKLREMYHYCTIIEVRVIDEVARGEGTDLEGAISLIVGLDKK